MLFGADPEVFSSYNKDGKDYVLPPAYFRSFLGLGHEPDIKHPKFLVKDGIVIHEDGAAFEFSLPPSKNLKDLFDNIHHGYNLLQSEVLKDFPEYPIVVVPTINYEVDRWNQYRKDQDFFMSLMFGCDPHMNAWNMEEDRPVDARKHPYRYGGGHIHLSGIPQLEENPILCIRTLDATVGLAATAYSPVPELEKLRTFRYGLAGVWRPQQYPNGDVGLEYRSVSNSWTNPKFTELASMIQKWITIATEVLIPDGKKAEKILDDISDNLLFAIKSADQNLSLKMLEFVEASL